MRIAILAWGSLIWKPGHLSLAGEWRSGGPMLPIEFSRISGGDRLTLVIDPRNGQPTQTRFAISRHASLAEAIEDLRAREGTSTENIGFVTSAGEAQCRTYPAMKGELVEWLKQQDLDAVIWTDLPSNFEEKRLLPFSTENAVAYLSSLPPEVAEVAREYIQRAPDEVDSPVRRALNKGA